MTQNISEHSKLDFIPGFFRHDFLRKAIALFFAVLFYLIVTSRLGIEEQINNVPVDIDLPTTLVNIGENTPRVSLIVKGSKGILKQTSRTSFRISASVKASEYINGEIYTLRLTNDNISAPLGVTILRIEPRDLMLNLDRKVSKKIKVSPTFANKDALPQGYAVEKVSFQPAEVLVAGPESIVEKLYRLKSEPIPLSASLTDSFDYMTEIQKEPSVTLSPEKVNAQVKIIRQNKTVTLKNVPIKVMEAAEKSGEFKVELLSSPHVAITLSGLKSTIDLLKNDSVKPYIDISALESEGTFSVNVSCSISSSEELTIKSIYPDKVQVKITKN